MTDQQPNQPKRKRDNSPQPPPARHSPGSHSRDESLARLPRLPPLSQIGLASFGQQQPWSGSSSPALYQLAPIASLSASTSSSASTASLDALASVASSASVELLSPVAVASAANFGRTTPNSNWQPSNQQLHSRDYQQSPNRDTLDLDQPPNRYRYPYQQTYLPSGLSRPAPYSPSLNSPPPPPAKPSRAPREPPTIDRSDPLVQAALTARKNSKSVIPSLNERKGSLLPTSSIPTTLPTTAPASTQSKVTLAAEATCERCHTPIASLILRGKYSQFESAYEPRYVCANCQPIPEESEPSGSGSNEVGGDDDDVTYPMSWSAMLDRLQGIEIGPAERRRVPTKKTAGQKRRVEGQEPVLVCDVCWRDLGTGGVLVTATGKPVEFGIETVCASCSSKYQRCTDCGGGGGTRIGVGKWRSRHLFGEDRRSCSLSHIRLGSPEEMTYDIWAQDEIESGEFDRLLVLLKQLYTTSMISSLAIPDQLESALFASTYEEVHNLTQDTWTLLEIAMREDVKQARNRGIRRYYGLRWSTPTPRKKTKRKLSSATASSSTHTLSPEPVDDQPTSPLLSAGSVIRPGKTLASVIVCEMDLTLGSAFFPLVVPTGTGDGYDSGTILIQTLLTRIQGDIASTNALRDVHNQLPLLTEVWSTHLHKRESSFFNRLGERRGFMALEDYVNKIPTASLSHFPPRRTIFMPNAFVRNWQVVARTWSPSEDMTLRIRRSRKGSNPTIAETPAA